MIVKGQKINDRYEIIRVIGEGGMANVYLANDTILNRKVAVKVLRGDLANDEKFVRRFQREALSASSLNHPNIVEMYDVGEDDGNFYIVMEYVDGKNLKQLIKRRTKLSLTEVVDIMKQLTDGISHAHDSFIIHRDIKPQNMLILDNGLVKITDFGIAVALNSTQLTQTNSVMGSVHYLPPEQAAGKGATFKSDIYSLGIMMYELITGKLPFRGENAVEIALKQMKEPIPSIREDNNEIPQAVENIVLKACAKNPKNRYDTAREMYNDLCTCLDEERKNEPKLVYKYPEFDETTKAVKEEVKEINEVNKEESDVSIKKENKKKNNNLTWILGGIVGFICIAFVVGIILLPKLTKVPDVKVPDVSNMTIVEAENILKEKGFVVNVNVIEEYNDTIEEGKIIRTSPDINRSIKKGSEITLYRSLGTEKIKIEDYTGMNIYEIKAKLELLGLSVTVESKDVENVEDYSDKEDTIIDQSIKEGELYKGDQIFLYYPNIVVFPDLTTYTLQEVQDFALKYELDLHVVEIETESIEEGTIISQNRTKGTLIVRNAELTVKIAVKPKIENVPQEELDINNGNNNN
ncbi:MAG: Stk1 family PASTA domain-containing Ser/Thr kinase [Tenericutes bacterium]|mgnify:CR=1 FL=1|nr:Stk1 family PASTA domain-containing Ser/Thr kinase [Mycoplasmatota bacterium]MDD7629723.1 Stk1 family PASTA domain-containing Ser/Thr kinase [bacterium]MDY4108527.1 Stk1 family PASTA domain-containing Ser/Thr kinase [Bacilli bacterium]